MKKRVCVMPGYYNPLCTHHIAQIMELVGRFDEIRLIVCHSPKTRSKYPVYFPFTLDKQLEIMREEVSKIGGFDEISVQHMDIDSILVIKDQNEQIREYGSMLKERFMSDDMYTYSEIHGMYNTDTGEYSLNSKNVTPYVRQVASDHFWCDMRHYAIMPGFRYGYKYKALLLGEPKSGKSTFMSICYIMHNMLTFKPDDEPEYSFDGEYDEADTYLRMHSPNSRNPYFIHESLHANNLINTLLMDLRHSTRTKMISDLAGHFTDKISWEYDIVLVMSDNEKFKAIIDEALTLAGLEDFKDNIRYLTPRDWHQNFNKLHNIFRIPYQ